MQSKIDDKTFTGMQARAALVGCELRRFTNSQGVEEFEAHKWALSKTLQSADQVEDFLHRAGAPSA